MARTSKASRKAWDEWDDIEDELRKEANNAKQLQVRTTSDCRVEDLPKVR